MVAVIVAGRSIVAVAMIHLHLPYESEPCQEVHRSVDAGQADPGIDGTGAAMDFCNDEMVRGVRQDPKNGLPCAGQSEPLSLQGIAATTHGHRRSPYEKYYQ
jgi:hypothetical protein